ncbi:Roadblock/LC7 domain protein, partial [Ostertagia ostertagi]
MLRQKALEEVLGQVNTAGVTGALLFNREGLLLAYNGYGDNKDHANISAALISSIWESFDKKGGREDLQESIIVCEDGIVAATRVANMLLAVESDQKLSVGSITCQASCSCQVPRWSNLGGLKECLTVCFRHK